jgi:prepilin-type N-terminal cleavage/methylation domain-containing protein
VATHHAHGRAAFTLPEVLLAIMIFAVGILGLASTATFIAAQTGDARRLLDAAEVAGARLDSLRATPCATLAPGLDTFVGGTVAWTVSTAPRSRSVRLTLTTVRSARTNTILLDALLPCDP